MENVDREMENRVWQRVHSRKPAPPLPAPQRDNLKPWILAAQENAAACRNLQLQLIGKQWEGLRRLEMENGRLLQALRGVSALQGDPVRLTPLATPKDPPRRCLEKSFHRTCRIREELEKRAQSSEYGAVFRSLARRAEDQCAILAELIGRLEL